MKAISDYLKSWTTGEAILAGLALVCATVMAVVITIQNDWGKLTHWLSSGDAMSFAIAVGTLAGVIYSRARRLPPTILVLALLGVTLSGCGHMSDAARVAYATEQAHCIANQRAIVERTGTTAEQDEADFDAEVARCDAALAEIAGE